MTCSGIRESYFMKMDGKGIYTNIYYFRKTIEVIYTQPTQNIEVTLLQRYLNVGNVAWTL